MVKMEFVSYMKTIKIDRSNLKAFIKSIYDFNG